jgi:hypothetical protein
MMRKQLDIICPLIAFVLLIFWVPLNSFCDSINQVECSKLETITKNIYLDNTEELIVKAGITKKLIDWDENDFHFLRELYSKCFDEGYTQNVSKEYKTDFLNVIDDKIKVIKQRREELLAKKGRDKSLEGYKQEEILIAKKISNHEATNDDYLRLKEIERHEEEEGFPSFPSMNGEPYKSSDTSATALVYKYEKQQRVDTDLAKLAEIENQIKNAKSVQDLEIIHDKLNKINPSEGESIQKRDDLASLLSNKIGDLELKNQRNKCLPLINKTGIDANYLNSRVLGYAMGSDFKLKDFLCVMLQAGAFDSFSTPSFFNKNFAITATNKGSELYFDYGVYNEARQAFYSKDTAPNAVGEKCFILVAVKVNGEKQDMKDIESSIYGLAKLYDYYAGAGK